MGLAAALMEKKKEGGREREGLGLIPARLRAEAAGSCAATVRSVHNQHGVDQDLSDSLGWQCEADPARPCMRQAAFNPLADDMSIHQFVSKSRRCGPPLYSRRLAFVSAPGLAELGNGIGPEAAAWPGHISPGRYRGLLRLYRDFDANSRSPAMTGNKSVSGNV
jgi:hypothetical protein